MPMISVIVSVYNCEKYIGETIESIINQTYKDWELIIIDDNSKDKSAEIIDQYAKRDNRIRYIRNTDNRGQCENLNTAIKLSNGEYIAHTDHDDVSYPDRLEKQLLYMDENPTCILCGCMCDIWTEGRIIDTSYAPKFNSMNEIRFALPMANWIAHSTFFWKKKALTDNGIYYGKWDYAEDYDLLLRTLGVGEVGFVSKPLVFYRDFPQSVTHTINRKIITGEATTIRESYIRKQTGLDTDIWIMEEEGRLKTRADYKRWDNLLENYASACGVSNGMLIKEVNWLKYCDQEPSMVLIMSYISSKWRGSLRNIGRLVKMFLRHRFLGFN